MTGKEVRKLTDEEIGVEIKRLRADLHTVRTQFVTAKVEDSSKYGKIKKDIARLLTERTARRAAAAR
jgi:ribosomal protein L29